MDAEYPATAGGFTFADKRKVNPDGTARVPVDTEVTGAAAVPEGTAADTELSELLEAEVEVDVDPNAALAADRLADLQRLQAEYANYRKRVDRDRNVARDSAIASVLESLLPVLDDIYLARQHGDLETGPFVSIAEKLESTLRKYGVERYGSPGEPFDPAIHDALMHVEAELAEGTEVSTVVGILQPGYRVGEKIIRPARVSVADPA